MNTLQETGQTGHKKKKKINPTGTRTATRQISPGNPSQKTQEEKERPVREKIIYYHHRNEGKKKKRRRKETCMKAPMSGQTMPCLSAKESKFCLLMIPPGSEPQRL